ncbi:649_t:CDS:1, partial [Racocetra persica]
SSIFKGTILDSFEKNGYIFIPLSPDPPQSYFEKAKKFASDNPKTTFGALTAGGLLLGPLAAAGLVGAAGFGSGGIAAGSAAAWMMSLQGGATAAGSLVAILQSVGAAGLGVTGTLLSSTAGAAILNGLSAYITNNPEKLEILENFVKIYDEGGENDNLIVVFEIRNELLTNDEALDEFFKIFDLTLPLIKTKRFKFLIHEECATEGLNILNNRFVTTYGEKCVEPKQQIIMLNLG